jgi:hypothetical protein
MKTLVLLLLTTGLVGAQANLEVVHKKSLWFDQKGAVRIDDSGISFQPAGKDEQSRTWTYEDIQFLDRVSPTEFRLLSYEDVAWRLGQDRRYRFVLTSGKFTDEVLEYIATRMDRPITNRVVGRPVSAEQPGEQHAEQELPAKHLTTFGGSEGSLYFSPERILYVTDSERKSREWLVARDVQSVWSADRYRLELQVYEDNRGGFRMTKVYKFALKKPLDPEFYRRLKLKLYEIDRRRDLMP